MPEIKPPKSKRMKKLTKEQRSNLELVFAWYNFAWAMSNEKHKEEQKRIGLEAIRLIEDIVL